MDYEQAVMAMLATEENLPTALEIADIVARWRNKMHRAFWQELLDALKIKMANSNYNSNWEVRFNDKSNKYRNDWFACSIEPKNTVPGQRYYRGHIQQRRATDRYLFKYGFARNNPAGIDAEVKVKEVQILSTALIKEGFLDSESHWIGIKYLDYGPIHPEILVRMATDRQKYIEETASMVWIPFEKFVEPVEAAHAALAMKVQAT